MSDLLAATTRQQAGTVAPISGTGAARTVLNHSSQDGEVFLVDADWEAPDGGFFMTFSRDGAVWHHHATFSKLQKYLESSRGWKVHNYKASIRKALEGKTSGERHYYTRAKLVPASKRGEFEHLKVHFYAQGIHANNSSAPAKAAHQTKPPHQGKNLLLNLSLARVDNADAQSRLGNTLKFIFQRRQELKDQFTSLKDAQQQARAEWLVSYNDLAEKTMAKLSEERAIFSVANALIESKNDRLESVAQKLSRKQQQQRDGSSSHSMAVPSQSSSSATPSQGHMTNLLQGDDAPGQPHAQFLQVPQSNGIARRSSSSSSNSGSMTGTAQTRRGGKRSHRDKVAGAEEKTIFETSHPSDDDEKSGSNQANDSSDSDGGWSTDDDMHAEQEQGTPKGAVPRLVAQTSAALDLTPAPPRVTGGSRSPTTSRRRRVRRLKKGGFQEQERPVSSSTTASSFVHGLTFSRDKQGTEVEEPTKRSKLAAQAVIAADPTVQSNEDEEALLDDL